MAIATRADVPGTSLLDQKLKKSSPGKVGVIIFTLLLVGELIYIVTKLSEDLSIVHTATVFPYVSSVLLC